MSRDCINRIVQMSKGALSEKEAQKMLDDLTQEAKKRYAKGEDFDEAVAAVALEKRLALKEQGELERRNTLLNLIKDKELTQRIDSVVAAGETPEEAIQSILVGTSKNIEQGRYSIDAKQKQMAAKLIGGVVRDLEHENLLPFVNQKTMQREVARELWELSLEKGGKPGVSGSKEAKRIAEIFHKYQEAARIRQNRAGAAIGKVDGYVSSQSHNQARMLKQGYDKWREMILTRLDPDRTFKGADPEEFLRAAYNGLVTGIHLKTNGVDDGKLFQFKGPSNLAKRVSKERVLHFKSADDWIEYNNAFGRNDVYEGVLYGLERAARNIALMETLGTNPQAMFDRMLDKVRAKYRDDKRLAKGIDGQAARLRNFFSQVDGSLSIADYPRLANIGSIIRAWQSTAKLGGAVISSISDLPLKASELQYQGVGVLDSYAQSFVDIFQGRGTKERKELASVIGVGFDGMIGAITARFSATDELPGTMAKMQRLFFKFNGLQWWTDVNKIGTGIGMSHRLAQQRAKGFDKLDVDTQRLFRQFGVDDARWDAIRLSAVKEMDGNRYITPDAIQLLTDEQLLPIAQRITGSEKISPRKLQSVRDDIESRLQSYFIDRADIAAITPGAREQAIVNQGYARGTVGGEFLRFMMQFKSFPISVISKVWGRALYGKGKADVPAIIQLALMTTGFGYIAMSAKDVLKGREPRDPQDPKVWASAFVQGGGAGIMGDFVFGEFNRFGQDLLSTAAGPTFGSVNDLARIYGRVKSGDDASSAALKTAIDNTPFANLFYLRPALNYLFLYNMQEQLNPGYLRRMERRVEQENGQKFLIRPSDIAK